MRTLIGPTAEPIALEEAKHQRRVTHSDEDELIKTLVASARSVVETETGLRLIHQQVEYRRHGFGGVIELPTGPLQAVSAIKYLDTSGNLQTLDASKYNVYQQLDRALIEPAYGETWPSTYDELGAVRVEFWAGYAVPFTVDENTDTITAVNHQFEDGDIVRIQKSGDENTGPPGGLEEKTNYYVINVSGDDLQLSTSEGGTAIDISSAGTGQFFLGEIPQQIRQAMHLIIGHQYENREAAITGTIITELPMGAKSLLGPYRQFYP